MKKIKDQELWKLQREAGRLVTRYAFKFKVEFIGILQFEC